MSSAYLCVTREHDELGQETHDIERALSVRHTHNAVQKVDGTHLAAVIPSTVDDIIGSAS